MKRTEMIDKLETYINDRCYQDYKWSTEEIEGLLTFIEQQGMKPPHISKEATQAALHLYYGGFSYNQWDEDLLKDEKLQAELNRRAEWNAKSPEEKKAIRQARREARSKRL